MPKLNAYAIQKPRIAATLEDVYKIKKNSDIRLTATPFVENAEDVVFIGGAAPWKGLKGPKGGGVPKELREQFPKIADGLERAIEISQSCKGVTGTVLFGGRLLPKKVLCQIEKAG